MITEKTKRPKCRSDVFSQLPTYVDHTRKESSASEINFSEILTKDGSNLKCVLVEGAPGIGKSVFTWKLCQEWAEGKLFQEYDLVIQLKMRDQSVQKAKVVSDFFQHSDPELKRQIAEEVNRSDGRGVLLIFDAIDELPSLEIITKEGSIFKQIFTGIALPQANVLITCRSWATASFLEVCTPSRHLELLGFSEDDVSQYISCAFPDEHEHTEFENYLSLYSFAETMMNVPLLTSIVVSVYQKSPEKMPNTMTGFYRAQIRSLMLAHLKKHPEKYREMPDYLQDLESLPPLIRRSFLDLCEMAYTGITGTDDRINFTKPNLPSEFDPLGLMQLTTEQFTDHGTAASYSFPHPTVQEFLAAYHLSLQPEIEQKSFFEHHSATCRLDVIMRFLCGLSQFSSSLWQSLEKPTAAAAAEKSTALHMSMGNKVCYLQWLYEAQNPEVCATYLGGKHIDFSPDCQLKSFDFYVLGYCIYYSCSKWMLDLTFARFKPSSAEILSKFPASVCLPLPSQSPATGCISSLKVSSKEYTDRAFCLLLSVPQRMLHSLTELDLEDNQGITSKSCRQLAKCINEKVIPDLQTLKVGDTSLGDCGSVYLIDALIRSHKIEVLSLAATGIGPKAAENLIRLLLSSRKLLELNLRENPQLSNCLERIAIGLQQSSLQVLDLSGIPFTPDATFSLSVTLKNSRSLEQLYLVNCEIDRHKAEILADHLRQSRLQVLYMSANPVGKRGSKALANMLQENRSLKKLHLVDPSVGITGACEFITALEHNKEVKLCLHEQCCPPEFENTGPHGVMKRCYFVRGSMY